VNEPAYAALVSEFGHARVVAAIREQVGAERQGEETSGEARLMLVSAALRAAVAPRLRHVINATGVILHTNLGRAPLSRAAVEALATAAGYSNLELDLDSGRRGERASLLSGLLTELFACEAAFAVKTMRRQSCWP
jgi:L-seryl-tRNA(Ser) seleniumtransferase